LAHEKPSEEEQRRRDRRRSRKSMEFMLGFESLFGSDWQAESRVQGKLSEVGWPTEIRGKLLQLIGNVSPVPLEGI